MRRAARTREIEEEDVEEDVEEEQYEEVSDEESADEEYEEDGEQYEDEEYEEEEYEEPPPGLPTHFKISMAAGGILILALIAHQYSKPSDAPKAAAPATKDTTVPPPAITISHSVENTTTTVNDWVITKTEHGAYRVNGKRIMGNWTLKDDKDNIQFLTGDQKAQVGEALNRFDQQHKK
jgi:hypothetical protein